MKAARPGMSQRRTRRAMSAYRTGLCRTVGAVTMALSMAGLPAVAASQSLRLLSETAEFGPGEAVIVRAYQAVTPLDDILVEQALREADAGLAADRNESFDFVYFFVYPSDLAVEVPAFPDMENSLAAFQFMRVDPASAGWRWRYARDTEEGKLLICENEWQPGCHMSLRRKK